jgi:ketosteroid isomerase-like protein
MNYFPLKNTASAAAAIAACLALVTIVGCDAGSRKDDQAAQVRAVDAQWSATAGRHDVDGTVAFYAEDAMLLPPDAPAISDKKLLRTFWAGFLKSVDTLAWQAGKVDVSASGDVAYETGNWTTTAKSGHGVETDHGKFVEVWKKQADGKWKCVVDMFNNDQPAAPAAR